MINFNGTIISDNDFKLTYNNRAFKYGDSIFETLKIKNGRILFWEDHYFRLMASMRMLRMEIPLSFTLEFLEDQILKVSKALQNQDLSRARLSIYRKDGGFYTPKTNEVDFVIEAQKLEINVKDNYRVDLFKDFYNFSGMLSTVKTNNKILNSIASVYAKENDLDNCILLNERKGVCEFINGNIFIIKDNIFKTPALTEGCLKGIVRKKVIEIVSKNPNYEVEAYLAYNKTTYPKFFEKKSSNNTYDYVFFFQPWKEIYETDNERYETYEESLEINHFLIKTYSKYNYNLINVPYGSINDRANYILNFIK